MIMIRYKLFIIFIIKKDISNHQLHHANCETYYLLYYITGKFFS